MPIHLSVSQLNLSYGKTQVLHDVALEVEAGHILALIGPQGAGKSSFLRAVNRMADLDGAVYSGSVALNGSSIFMMEPTQLRTRVGMVLSQPVLFPGTVLDNIVGGLRLRGEHNRDLLHEKAEKALNFLGIYKDFYPLLAQNAATLPPARQQLVCICRTLALEPGLLLMDEPSRFLDTVSVLILEEALFNLKKSCTVVYATPVLQQAGRLADETALLIGGEIVEWGSTGDLFAHPRNPVTEQYLTGRTQ